MCARPGFRNAPAQTRSPWPLRRSNPNAISPAPATLEPKRDTPAAAMPEPKRDTSAAAMPV